MNLLQNSPSIAKKSLKALGIRMFFREQDYQKTKNPQMILK
jgi:hypothetical protein